MQRTITLAEANQRVEEYAAQARTALPAEAVLRLEYIEKAGSCSDPTDNGPKNRLIATRDYAIDGLSKSRNESYFDTLRKWWLEHNFRILDNNPKYEFLWVEKNDDGFRMTLKSSPSGDLYLISVSPCVWENGTPVPDTNH